VALSVRFYSASHCRFSVGCLLVSKGLYQVLLSAFLLLSFAISLSWIHSVCLWGFGGALLVVALDFPHFLCSLGFSSFFSRFSFDSPVVYGFLLRYWVGFCRFVACFWWRRWFFWVQVRWFWVFSFFSSCCF
jgi:hypothetical protein